VQLRKSRRTVGGFYGVQFLVNKFIPANIKKYNAWNKASIQRK